MLNKCVSQDIQQALNAIRGEFDGLDDETKWVALELMLVTNISVAAHAKKMANPKSKTVTCTAANWLYG